MAEKIEPFGEARADYRAAAIMLYIAGAFSKRPPSFGKILDMFDFNKSNRRQTDEQMEMIFRQVISAGKPRKKRKDAKAH